ncbi:hypothetical protein [Clostridium sp. BJN0013]|uniref:hypothetical protein n=1 Tax=Clostridium sp. BJN0013 TaxID=3236840 RepID=UPI0034C65DBF
MPEAIRQNKMNKFAIISLILATSLFAFAGLLHTVLGSIFIVIPINTIVFAVLSLVKPCKGDTGSAGVLGIIMGIIYIGFFMFM